MYNKINKEKGVILLEFECVKGFKVTLSNYGASIYSIYMPDANGKSELITLSPDDASYFRNPKYCGLTVGRIAGRLRNGEYTMNGKIFKVDTEGEKTLLHSGKNGLAYKLFDYVVEEDNDNYKIDYSILIKDMEDGFTGDFDFHVIYTISKKNMSIGLEFKGVTSKDAILNITNHSYFNLNGDLRGNILDHVFTINKESIGVLDELSILLDVKPVPGEFNFKNGKMFRDDFNKECVQNPRLGYDDYFTGKDDLSLSLFEKKSGRLLKVTSNYKDCVVYTNNYSNETIYINGVKDVGQKGVAIEPCRFTNILKENGIVQKAGVPYDYYINYDFSVRK